MSVEPTYSITDLTIDRAKEFISRMLQHEHATKYLKSRATQVYNELFTENTETKHHKETNDCETNECEFQGTGISYEVFEEFQPVKENEHDTEDHTTDHSLDPIQVEPDDVGTEEEYFEMPDSYTF